VTVKEGLNARYFPADDIGEPIGLETVDMLTIALQLALPWLVGIVQPEE